jgi:putative two-component system response regulator
VSTQRTGPERGTILIVDDDAVFHHLYGRLLSTQGYTVRSAKTSEEALVMLSDGDLPDLMLVDVMMADIDGVELCSRLREDERTRDLPIVLVTGLEDRETRIRARQVAEDILVKPVDSLELLLCVKARLAVRARVVGLRTEVQTLRAALDHAEQRLRALGE